jgi:hypothetical protein
MQLQLITKLIKSDAVSQLGMAQTHEMPPRIEGPEFLLCFGLWNKVPKLAQDFEFATDWKFLSFSSLLGRL